MLIVAASAGAQSAADDLGDAGSDAWAVVSAPAGMSGRDAATLALVAGTFGGLLLVDEPVRDWLRDHPDFFLAKAVQPFAEGTAPGRIGRTLQFLLPASAAVYVLGIAGDSRNLRDAGIGCATSNLTTTLTRTGLARLIGRLRPSYDGDAFSFEPFAFGSWEMRSFFGGHVANLMSCASFLGHRFELGAAEPLLYGTAAVLGTARIVDEIHWTSDSFTGAAYGFAVGRAVGGRQLERRRTGATSPTFYVGWRVSLR